MRQRRSRLRTVHRAHTFITVLAVATLVALNLTGHIGGGMALRLFLLIEVPLLLAFLLITLLRFRSFGRSGGDDETSEAPGSQRLGLLDRIEAEEPLMRPVVAEIRAFGSLILVIGRKRRVPDGARPFGYAAGSMAFPVVIIALSLVELAVVHVLVPWPWLRIVLLVLTVWGVLFMLGFLSTRVVYPHFLTGNALHLRWGYRSVLETPLSNIVSVTAHSDHAHTQPYAEGERLILTQFQGTNVLLRFAKPVPAIMPMTKKQTPADFHVREVQLHVDQPDAFLRACTPLPDGAST